MGNNARYGLTAAGCNACQSHTTYNSKTVSFHSTSGGLISNGYYDAGWTISVFFRQIISFFAEIPPVIVTVGRNFRQSRLSSGCPPTLLDARKGFIDFHQ
jgi:hypothetical protein